MFQSWCLIRRPGPVVFIPRVSACNLGIHTRKTRSPVVELITTPKTDFCDIVGAALRFGKEIRQFKICSFLGGLTHNFGRA